MGDAEDETPVPEADADEEDSPAPTFVAEAEELRDLVRAAVANVATPEQYARLHAIVRAHRRLPEEAAQDAGRSVEAPSHAHCSFRRPRRGAQFMKYQEQPQLLDPHLEPLVEQLMEVVRQQARLGPSADLVHTLRCSRVLQVMASVRGHKTLLRFFPHEAADLEPCMALLAEHAARGAEAGAVAITPGDEDNTSGWETAAVLLLWLCILVMVPFDLATLDTSLAGGGAAGGMPPLVARVVAACKAALSEPGVVRNMAAEALARLYTRPDLSAHLGEFLAWARGAMATQGRPGLFLVPGAAATLAAIFKLGARTALLPLAPVAWADAQALAASPAAAGSTLVRKLAVKLGQRLCLLFLAPRVVAWRYCRGGRSLEDNLRGDAAAGEAAEAAAAAAAEEEDEEFEIVDAVEEVVEMLLTGLRDKDTVVRWSAAKGIGRITSRLPLPLASEVLNSVLELFSPTETDSAWHGACLALAELARRGLLLPARLGEVMPQVTAAMAYDVRRGPHSVGAHVRDAAAYVCWAFARAYAPEVIAPYAHAVAPALLTAAVFDREVNCRRAASAAFQECVGRLGADAFPNGIEIVTIADYFSIGARPHAFCVVARQVAAFPQYRPALLHHLLHVKLRHWEKSLRELAAEALAALTPADAAWVGGVAVPALLEWTLHPDLATRHGAAVALARAVPALAAAGWALPPATAAALAGAVPAVERARLYRGKGGEVMRGAVCALVASLAEVRLPLDDATQAALLSSLEESMRHPTPEIQTAAVAGLSRFASAYLLAPGGGAAAGAVERTAGGYVAALGSESNPAARRGLALALGGLPAPLLAPVAPAALAALAAASRPEEAAEARDAETRVHAVRSLAAAVVTLGVRAAGAAAPDAPGLPAQLVARPTCHPAPPPSLALPHTRARRMLPQLETVLPALQRALEDYCTDNRGDVGSWVREAALHALATVLAALADAAPEAVGEELAVALVGGMLKQAAEKIDRQRDAAARALGRLLAALPPTALGAVPHAGALRAAFPRVTAGPTTYSAAPWPALAELLVAAPRFRAPLLAGLIVSGGGLGDSVSRAASGALLAVLAEQEPGDAPAAPGGLIAAVAAELTGIMRAHARVDRVTLPTLRLLDTLFAMGPFRRLAGGGAAAALGEVLACVRAEVRASRDIVKINAATTVLTHLCEAGDAAAREGALQLLLALLAHAYPKVRVAAAEALYVHLLAADADDAGGGDPEAAAELLSQTQWDATPEAAREAAARVGELLRVPPPEKPLLVAPKPKAGAKAGAGKQADENATYRSLVDDAGY